MKYKAQQIINNGDATEQQITNETNRVNQAINAINKAKNDLRADKSQLENAYNQLIQNVDTNGKNLLVFNNTKLLDKLLRRNTITLNQKHIKFLKIVTLQLMK